MFLNKHSYDKHDYWPIQNDGFPFQHVKQSAGMIFGWIPQGLPRMDESIFTTRWCRLAIFKGPCLQEGHGVITRYFYGDIGWSLPPNGDYDLIVFNKMQDVLMIVFNQEKMGQPLTPVSLWILCLQLRGLGRYYWFMSRSNTQSFGTLVARVQ